MCTQEVREQLSISSAYVAPIIQLCILNWSLSSIYTEENSYGFVFRVGEGYTCVATVCTLKLKKYNLSNPGYILRLMSPQNALYKHLYLYLLIIYIYIYIYIYNIWSFDGLHLWLILD